jgi:ribosome-binding protein aMBF1 (putative translation factor)
MKCKLCGEEADELRSVKVQGRARKVCEDCADRLEEEAEIGAEAESVMQGMMEYKGRR